METKTIPKDWPKKIRLAARTAATVSERRKLTEQLEDLLRSTDPMDLRLRGLNAEQRRAVYARQVDAQLRAA